MRFSEYFQVDPNKLKKYGAFDISLVCDMPLFIDPMLIFTSKKREYKELHAKIIEYFFHVYNKSQLQEMTDQEKQKWLTFSEIKNNWLGYSVYGNGGLGPGESFADDLSFSLELIFPKDKISESYHFERILLFGENIGKDKISDLTVNILFRYFLEYTVAFANENIDEQFLHVFSLERMIFDDENKPLGFKDAQYKLPYIKNHYGLNEFVILTPKDILRFDNQAINKKDFVQSYEGVLETIDNKLLRLDLSNYITSEVEKLIRERRDQKRSSPTPRMIEKKKQEAFEIYANLIDPRVFDYYLKMKESQGHSIQTISAQEVTKQKEKFLTNSERLAQIIVSNSESINDIHDLKKEGLRQIQVLKRSIENGGAECLNYEDKPIKNEQDLRRFLRLTFHNVFNQVALQSGDYRIAKRMGIAEERLSYKLASNRQLGRWLENPSRRIESRWDQKNPVVIFYFDENHLSEAKSIIVKANLSPKIDKLIYFIDCQVSRKNDK